jgi:spermidine/putrescine-binding protein
MKEKIKFILPVSIIILIVLGFAFYWFEWRPNQTRKECYNFAKQQAELNYLLTDEGINESVDNFLAKKMAEEKGLPELTTIPRTESFYLENGFNDSYKNCLIKNGLEK